MKIIPNNKIKSTLKKVAPNKIAVAYVGIDWKEYVNFSKDDLIIVSPTLGSNPNAIIEIVELIGWGNVHFLNNLHAKIYIGKNSAFISSSNLSKNGIDSKGLIEIGVLVNSKNEIEKIDNEFNNILKLSKKQYKNSKEKKLALKKLFKIHKKAVADKIIRKEGEVNSFEKYANSPIEEFYISYYTHGEIEKTSEEYQKHESLINDELHLRIEDKIDKSTWILVWKRTNNFKPNKNSKPYWLFVHDILKDAILENEYPYQNCAIERNDLEIPVEPFYLDDKFIEIFKDLISNQNFSKYFVQKDKDYDMNYSKKGLKKLIEEIKKRYKNENGMQSRR